MLVRYVIPYKVYLEVAPPTLGLLPIAKLFQNPHSGKISDHCSVAKSNAPEQSNIDVHGKGGVNKIHACSRLLDR